MWWRIGDTHTFKCVKCVKCKNLKGNKNDLTKRVKELQSSRSEEDAIPIEQLLETEGIGGLQAAASNDLITEGNDFTMMVHHMLLKN